MTNLDRDDDSEHSPITYVGPARGDKVRDALWWAVGVALIVGAVVWAGNGGPLP